MTLLRLKIDLLVAGCLAGVVQPRADGHKWKEQLKRGSYLGQSVDNGQQVFLQSPLFKTCTRVRSMESTLNRITWYLGVFLVFLLCSRCCELQCIKLHCAVLKLYYFWLISFPKLSELEKELFLSSSLSFFAQSTPFILFVVLCGFFNNQAAKMNSRLFLMTEIKTDLCFGN